MSSCNSENADRHSIPETLISRCASETGSDGIEPHGFALPQHYGYTKATLENELKRALGWGVRKMGLKFSRGMLDLLGQFCFHVINFHEQSQGGISIETTHILEITERVFRIYEPECFVRFENLLELDLSFITLRSWKNVVLPRKLAKLNLSQSNFRGTLRYLRDLGHLKMCDLHLDSWVDVMPPNLMNFDASFSNFHGDIRFLVQLKHLNLTGVSHEDWSGTCFPRSLEFLNLDKSDFRGDLAYLINLQPARNARSPGSARRVSFSEPAVITFEDDYRVQHKRVTLTPLKSDDSTSKIRINDFMKERRKRHGSKKRLIAFAFQGKPKLPIQRRRIKSSSRKRPSNRSRSIVVNDDSSKSILSTEYRTRKRFKDFMQHLKPERSRTRSRLEYVRRKRRVGKSKEVVLKRDTFFQDFNPSQVSPKNAKLSSKSLLSHHKRRRPIPSPPKNRVPPEIIRMFSNLARQYQKECPQEDVRFKAWADNRMKAILQKKPKKEESQI